MNSTVPDAAQRDAALDLIVAQQANPATACAYIGKSREGIVAELDDLTPPWHETLRVATRDGEVVAAACVDYDLDDTQRSWIHGPWASDDAAWHEHAAALLEAMCTLADVDDHEVSAAPANQRLASLATGKGWHTSKVNIAYVARSDQGWPDEDARVRQATTSDLKALHALHEAEFPATYASAKALLSDDERLTVVLDGEDGLDGYASAEVKADGEGYLDFLAVAPSARGRGLSKVLLAAIGRAMLASSARASVNLTVVGDNTAAIALYEGFGFVRDSELVGYRTKPYAHD